jgi:hypothetical protein
MTGTSFPGSGTLWLGDHRSDDKSAASIQYGRGWGPEEILQSKLEEAEERIGRLRMALSLELRVNDLSLSNDEWLVLMSQRRAAMRAVLDNGDLED